MKRIFFITYFLIFGAFAHADKAFSQPKQHEWRGKTPYGDYCPMQGWYGARKPVRTADEAKRILQEYFKNEPVVIGNIKEREWFFEAEIKDKNNKLLDIVIVDKRTGRIRSTY